MKRIFNTAIFSILLATFSAAILSCGQGIFENVEPSIPTVPGKACLRVSIQDTLARTIKPANSVKNSLDSIVLKGTYNAHAEEILKTWTSASDLASEVQIPNLNVGHWSFTLECSIGGVVVYTKTIEKDLVEGSNNKISFNLEEKDGVKGNVDITLDFSSCVNSGNVASVLLEYGLLGSSATTENLTVSGGTANFTKSGVSAGNYLFTFILKNSGGTEITRAADVVRVSPPLATTGTITLKSLNESFTIAYEMNGGNWKSSVTAPVSFTLYDDVTLPTDAKIEKDGYDFNGWFTDSAFTAGNEISGWTSNLSSPPQSADVTVYAKWTWHPSTEIYVSDSGNDANPGTLNNPVKTIAKALDLIDSINTGDGSQNFTIYILSNLSISTPISLEQSKTLNLTIEGKTSQKTITSDDTDTSHYMFNIGSNTDVTFKDISLSGVSGNGAIYNNGTLKLTGAVKVNTNNFIYLPSLGGTRRTITIAGNLTETAPIAKIKLDNFVYTDGTKVLDAATDVTINEAVCFKFALDNPNFAIVPSADKKSGVLAKLGTSTTITLPDNYKINLEGVTAGSGGTPGTAVIGGTIRISVTTENGTAVTPTAWNIKLKQNGETFKTFATNEISIPGQLQEDFYDLYIAFTIDGQTYDVTYTLKITDGIIETETVALEDLLEYLQTHPGQVSIAMDANDSNDFKNIVTAINSAKNDPTVVTTGIDLEIKGDIESIAAYSVTTLQLVTSLKFPSSLNYVGGNSFKTAPNPTYVEFTSPTLKIYSNSFLSNPTIVLKIPEGTTEIANNAFKCDSTNPGVNKISEVEIPNTVTKIGNYAFYDCSGIKTVKLSENLTSIGEYAFRGCSNLESVDIPSGVTTIGQYAFSNTKLTTVEIPNTVTSIGAGAFGNCARLQSITVEPGNLNYVSVDGVLFNADKTTLIAYPAGKTDTSYTIPNTVTTINASAFSSNKYLKNVTIPDTVTTIGNSAFYGCTALESVVLPSALTSIGDYVFSGCSSLESATNVKKLSKGMFSSCTSLKTVDLINVSYIYESVFSGCTSLESIDLPETLTYIDGAAFSGCTSLKAITIPSRVTNIRREAFRSCTSLETIRLLCTSVSLGDNALNSCSSLKDIYITGSASFSTIYCLKDTPDTCVAHVPAGQEDLYRTRLQNANFTGTVMGDQ